MLIGRVPTVRTQENLMKTIEDWMMNLSSKCLNRMGFWLDSITSSFNFISTYLNTHSLKSLGPSKSRTGLVRLLIDLTSFK